MFDQITEFDSAVMTAENWGEAYQMVDFTGTDNDDAQTELLWVLLKHHNSLSCEQMITVARQVIAQWITDYNN
jgi:hypothetical protein